VVIHEKSPDDFLEDEGKRKGDAIKEKVTVFIANSTFWSGSKYLESDPQGRQYLRVSGKLIYRGLTGAGRERYLLTSRLGNFILNKEEGRLLLKNYHNPKPGPLREI
jgi:hypothetical protein